MKRKTKAKNKGITIIQLIITIIVILIITGVIVARLTSNNGIVDNAKKATVKTEEARIMEILELALNNATVKYGDDLTLQEYIEELIDEGIIVQEDILIPNKYPFEDDVNRVLIQVGDHLLLFEISIDSNGKIQIKYIKNSRRDSNNKSNRISITIFNRENNNNKFKKVN